MLLFEDSTRDFTSRSFVYKTLEKAFANHITLHWRFGNFMYGGSAVSLRIGTDFCTFPPTH
jgi:hypothetical protein